MNTDKSLIFSTERFVNGSPAVVGGLCDRLKGLVFSYLVAQVTNRTFYVEWKTPFHIEDVFTPSKYDWRVEMAPCVLGDAKVTDCIDRGYLAIREEVWMAGVDVWDEFLGVPNAKLHINGFHVDVLKDKKGLLPVGCPSPDQPGELFKWAFDELLVYRPSVAARHRIEEFTDFSKSFEAVVGVQFRLGGSRDWRDPVLDDVKNIQDLVREVLLQGSQRFGTKCRFAVYVTCDCNEARKQIVTSFIEEGVSVFSFDAVPVHTERSDPQSVGSGVHQVALEHFVLSSCDFIVCGKGGFGQVAAWRGGVPFKRYAG